MKALDTIVKNPIIKAAFLKQLKKIMKDHNIKLIAVTMDEMENVDFTPYTYDVKIISKEEISKLIKLSLNESDK